MSALAVLFEVVLMWIVVVAAEGATNAGTLQVAGYLFASGPRVTAGVPQVGGDIGSGVMLVSFIVGMKPPRNRDYNIRRTNP